MTLTNDYQYIGRSNGVFNFGGAYQYYLLLYAKTSGSTATGKHRVSVKMRLACQIGVHFYGYNTTGYAKVAGQSAISWTAQPKPNAEWNQNLTEGGVTYPRWIDLQEGSTDVNVGYGVTKDVTLDASFQRLDMAAPPDFVPQTTPMTISINVTLPVIIPEAEAKPVVSMTLKPVSSLAAPFNSLYIQNLTKVDAELSAEGKYGATITSLQMVIGNAVYGDPYISGYLTQTGNVAVTGKATDSRGLVGTAEQIINVIPYSKPAIVPAEGQTDIVCARCDADGNFTDSGTYLRIIARRDYKPVDGKNFCTIRYRVIGGSWATILEGSASGDEVDKVISGVVTSTTASYSIEIGVVDTLGNTSSVTKIVPTDKVDVHLRDGGGGVAFGTYSSREGFECAMDAYFSGQTYRVADDGSVEWFFPPMEPGVEYRTAERFRNKPVYAKLLELDTMPNTAFAYMPFATGNSTEVISLTASAIRISDGFTRSLPFFDNGGTCNAVIGVNTQSGQVEVKTLYDFSGFKCTAVVRYIKN